MEDDASILKGTIDITTNEQLIMAVRTENPAAHIIYKPHPDVLSGNRKGKVKPKVTEAYCDGVEIHASISECLKAADEVHTLTSLVGFEGLIHNCKVHCYGIPFYAGWGLTQDRHNCARRNTKRSLGELIYASYFLYPLYYDWERKQYTNAIHTLSSFINASNNPRLETPNSVIHQRAVKYQNTVQGAYRAFISGIKKA